MSDRGGFGRKGKLGEGPPGVDPYAEKRAAFIAETRMAVLAGGEGGRTAFDAPLPQLVQPIEAPAVYHGNGNYDYPSNYAVEADARTLPSAYALWLLLGCVSGHRVYLGSYLSATIQTVLLWLGVAMILEGAGHVGAGKAMVLIFAVWWVIDLFRIPEMVRQRAVEDGVAFG